MTLLDGQYQYGSLLLGVGSPYGIRRIEGLEDLNVRSSDRTLPRNHGSVPGPHYASAKDVIVELVVKNSGDPETLAERLADLRAAFKIQATPKLLKWKRPGRVERQINVAPIQVQHVDEYAFVDRVAFPRIALTAADPRIYSTELHQATLSVYDPTGPGLDYPIDYPAEFPAPATGVLIHNSGSADAYPLVRFYGPSSGTTDEVLLRNVTTGQVQEVVTPIAPGQVLTVDNEAHVTGSGEQVVGLDGSTRYGSWSQPRTPLRLPPGDSLLRYEVVGETTTLCVVTWRDTWIP